MGAILAISLFLIVVASIALLRTKRTPYTRDAEELPPGVTPRGLFDDPGAECEGGGAASEADARAGALRARAERGDLAALDDAHATGDSVLYRFVLDGLVGHTAADAERLRALASHIARGRGLRSSPALAELFLAEWRRAPAHAPTAELLRLASLSDGADTFGLAVSEVLQVWEDGRLPGLGAEDLRSLFEGEYWLLSSEARRSGAGFVLRQKLADARRRLAARSHARNPNTDAAPPAEAPAQKERP